MEPDLTTLQLARDLSVVHDFGQEIAGDATSSNEDLPLRLACELRTLGWMRAENAERDEMRALGMEIVGRFSHVQELITETLVEWGSLCLEDLGIDDPRLNRLLENLDRAKDDDRIDLVKRFAAALDSDATLSRFKAVYLRAKRVRDSLGHGAVQYLDASGALVVQKLRGEPRSLSRAELAGAVRDCRWLDAQVLYVAVVGSRRDFHLGNPDGTVGPKLRLIRPTDSPETWNGTLYQSW